MQVIKKSEKKEKYSKKKLYSSIYSASKYLDKSIKDNIKFIVNEIDKKIKNSKSITTKGISNEIETYLVNNGQHELLEAFIYYKTHIKEVMKYKKKTTLDIKGSVDEYIKKTDWRVKENSNSAFSFSGLMAYVAGKHIGNYVLNEIYTKDVADAHRNGDMHIHDLNSGNIAYCCGWSLTDLLKKGFGHVEGKISSAPPKHLSTAVIQMVNFLGCFTKDTVLQTKEFGNVSFEELEQRNIKEFTVVSYNKEKDIFEEKTAYSLPKIAENQELIELELEDGLKIKCTLDHKFLVHRDGEKVWVEANELFEGEEIIVYEKK